MITEIAPKGEKKKVPEPAKCQVSLHEVGSDTRSCTLMQSLAAEFSLKQTTSLILFIN